MQNIVRLQSTIRMTLARMRYRRLRYNTDSNFFALVSPEEPALWFQFDRVDRKALKHGRRAYWSYNVERVLKEIGKFVYNNARSE